MSKEYPWCFSFLKWFWLQKGKHVKYVSPVSKSISASVSFTSKKNMAHKWYHPLCFRWLCLNPLLITGHVTSGRQKKNNPHPAECQSVVFVRTPRCAKWLRHLSGVLLWSHRKQRRRLRAWPKALSKTLSGLLTDEFRVLMRKVLNTFVLCQISAHTGRHKAQATGRNKIIFKGQHFSWLT